MFIYDVKGIRDHWELSDFTVFEMVNKGKGGGGWNVNYVLK